MPSVVPEKANCTHTHTYTHTRVRARDKNRKQEQSKKSGERKLLRNSRAVLDVFRSVGREIANAVVNSGFSAAQRVLELSPNPLLSSANTHTHTHTHTHDGLDKQALDQSSPSVLGLVRHVSKDITKTEHDAR